MAAVNACFVPEDGVAATNGGTPQEHPTNNTTNAKTAQQRSAGFWSGNYFFDRSLRNIGHFCSELRQCLTVSLENKSVVYLNYFCHFIK
jgi:hypothetical protein